MAPAVTDVAATEGGIRPADYLGCECCGQVCLAPSRADESVACSRCGHLLSVRKPHSLQRTWAYLGAASVLYIPANVLPIMSTRTALRPTDHTIAGGIAELWMDDAWGLATLVFIASIVVPVLKIAALALLAASTRIAPHWRRLDRARLYGLVEAVGHWSMLDVYVVVLLAAMVRFGGLASAQPEPGLLAFAAVVVFTMLATHSFDPRMIWQEPERDG
ncbi:MAG: paraquat-inducible protein A [Burkholderiaceae bacterium]